MESLASAIAGSATGSELTGEGARSMTPSPKIITNGRRGVPGTVAQRRRPPRKCRCQRSKSTHPRQSRAGREGREGKRPPGTTKRECNDTQKSLHQILLSKSGVSDQLRRDLNPIPVAPNPQPASQRPATRAGTSGEGGTEREESHHRRRRQTLSRAGRPDASITGQFGPRTNLQSAGHGQRTPRIDRKHNRAAKWRRVDRRGAW